MSPAFVLDCSVALTWCFEDESSAKTTQLLKRLEQESALVPSWWFLEVANVLAQAERKGRLSLQRSAAFVSDIERLNIAIDDEGPGRALTEILALCRSEGLTAHDALYLDVALRRQLPLATLDEPLRKAAKRSGVELLGK